MKNQLLAVVFLLFSGQFVSAQISAGGGLSFGSEIETVGLNLRGGYVIENQFNVGMDFNFFAPKKSGPAKVGWVGVNVNAAYWFQATDELTLYPLVGLNISSIRATANYLGATSSNRQTEIGLNLGGGVMYKIDNIAPFIEGKYVVSEFDQAVFSLGVLFLIN